eukprot:760523-Hanusia_phi.AAC.2
MSIVLMVPPWLLVPWPESHIIILCSRLLTSSLYLSMAIVLFLQLGGGSHNGLQTSSSGGAKLHQGVGRIGRGKKLLAHPLIRQKLPHLFAL